MQDPLITIYTLLTAAAPTGWNLTGDLARASVNFNTGWFDEEYTTPQVCVSHLTDEPVYLAPNSTLTLIKGFYQVDCMVNVKKQTSKGRGIAKKNLWDMRCEVLRILGSLQVAGATNIERVFLASGAEIPEANASTPRLKWSQKIEVQYYL